MTTFTDTERRFADSQEGRAAIARARMLHDTQEAHKGAGALPWTDAMEARAVRDGTTQRARSAVQSSAYVTEAERHLPALHAQADAARAKMITDLNSPR